jgi:hypothetical protein
LAASAGGTYKILLATCSVAAVKVS